jgi:hypothetical protein
MSGLANRLLSLVLLPISWAIRYKRTSPEAPDGWYNSALTSWRGGWAMTLKRVLCPDRVRQIPMQFSWLDHRLVRERYIERCDPPAAALYLFLVTVADAQGLSYYSDAALGRCLSLSPARLSQARSALMHLGLVAYQHPLYQVLSLDSPPRSQEGELGADEISVRMGQLRAILGRTP